jgi:hypothetical protein
MNTPDFQDRPVVRLRPKANARALRHGAPWVFDNELVTDRRTRSLPAGTLAVLEDAERRPLGLCGVNPGSRIIARMLDRDPAAQVDAAWFADPTLPRRTETPDATCRGRRNQSRSRSWMVPHLVPEPPDRPPAGRWAAVRRFVVFRVVSSSSASIRARTSPESRTRCAPPFGRLRGRPDAPSSVDCGRCPTGRLQWRRSDAARR